ncbi:hypothetical protein CDD83_4927 [Cordyceps sp. RAO-2017]|nr:hypothetical protein CDD83_4927 [Cordyceps sp. RAO-2017]
MRAPALSRLALLLHALPALADYGQTSRCYTALDDASRVLIPQFLRNISACAVRGEQFSTLDCAESQVAHDTFSVISPLTSTLRRWEAYFHEDVFTAFREHGRDMADNWHLQIKANEYNAWNVLLYSWLEMGSLCFYDNDPQFVGKLEPRAAGLLNLFFASGDLRTPILKVSDRHWRYNESTVCAARAGAERLRQARVVTTMAQQQQTGGSSDADPPADWQRYEAGSHYRELYSTDPFLQGVISGWRSGPYVCPEGLRCQTGPAEQGRVHLPADGGAFLRAIADGILKPDPVCILFRRTGSALAKNTYYVASSNEPEPEVDVPAGGDDLSSLDLKLLS